MVEVNKAGGGNTARTRNFSCLCVYGWPRVTLINEIMAPGPTHSRTEVSNVSRRGVGGYLRSFALHAFVPFCRAAYLSPRYLVPLVTRATSCPTDSSGLIIEFKARSFHDPLSFVTADQPSHLSTHFLRLPENSNPEPRRRETATRMPQMPQDVPLVADAAHSFSAVRAQSS